MVCRGVFSSSGNRPWQNAIFSRIERSVNWRMNEKKILALLKYHRSSEPLDDCWLVTRLTQDLLKSNGCRSIWGQRHPTLVDWSEAKAVKYATGAFLSDYRCSRLEWILFRFPLSRSRMFWCFCSLFTKLRIWGFPSYSRNCQDCHCSPMDEESSESTVSPLLKGGEWRADVRSLVFRLNKCLWGQRRSLLPVGSFVWQGDVGESSKKHFEDVEEQRERERTNLSVAVILARLGEIRFLRRRDSKRCSTVIE